MCSRFAGLPRAGAVEVDDVQRAGALLHPPPRGVERVGVVDGLAVVVALDEAHRMPPRMSIAG